jgi:hypothetical protein
MIFPILALVLLSFLPLLAAGDRKLVGRHLAGSIVVILGVGAALPDWDALADAPRMFVVICAGLAEVGLGMLVFSQPIDPKVKGIWRYLRSPDGWSLKGLARGVIFVQLGMHLEPLMSEGGWRGVVAAFGIAATGAVLLILVPLAKIPDAIRWLDQRWLAPKREADPCLGRRGRIIAWSTIGVALLVLLFVDHLFAAVASTLAIAVASHRLALDAGHAPKLPVVPIIAGLSLLTYLALISNIAGSEIGLGYPAILETPFSLRAEALLALILGAGLWVLLGLWPFHGAGPGSALAIVAGLLLTQWGARIIPMGIQHAAPLFAAVAVIAAFHAAATGRVGEYVASLGVLAVVAGVPQSWIFFALASAMALHRLSGKPSPIPGIERRELGGILLIPILAFLLPRMILGETVLTVAAVYAGVALFWPTKGR